MPDEPTKEVSQAGDMLEKVRAEYRDSLDATKLSRRELFKKAGKTAAAVAVTSILPGLPDLPFSSFAEAGGGWQDTEAQKRTELLRNSSLNDDRVFVWRNNRNRVPTNLEDYIEFRDEFKKTVSSDWDFTYEFDPNNVNSTWIFGNASTYRKTFENSVFLDSSGRAAADQGLGKFIDSLPTFEPLFYHLADIKAKLGKQQHALVIPKELVKDGYVIVFSRPSRPEKAEAFFDRWELDTSAFSDAVKVKAGHKAQNFISDAYFLLVDTQDRTYRVTPFYKKDDPAKVEKVVVLFDLTGQAISKFHLATTDFHPKGDWLENNIGQRNLTKTEINFLDWYTLPIDEQRQKLGLIVGGTIHVNTPGLRLHDKLIAPDHVQLDLIMDWTKYPQPKSGKGDGHSVEMRVTLRQFEEIKKRFRVLTEKTAGPGEYPGDIVIPEGADLIFRQEALPRGTDPRETYSEFVLLSVKSPK